MWLVLAVVCLGAWDVGAHASKMHFLPPRDLARPDRIVGGEPVKEGDFQWQVSIQQTRGNSLHSHFCGGTLISDTWVVTAAHCTKDIDYDHVVVVTGAWDLKQGGNEYKVEKVVRANYDEFTLIHDIALLKLNSKNPLHKREGSTAVPISLETRKEVREGQKCVISGWGRLEESGALPHILRAADVELKSDSQCNETYNSISYYVHDSNVCAGGGARDACQGDSGGPLVCCAEGSTAPEDCTLIGVTSWGIGCAREGLPGVYTEVAHYTPWIQDVIAKEGGNNSLEKIGFFKGGEGEEMQVKEEED